MEFENFFKKRRKNKILPKINEQELKIKENVPFKRAEDIVNKENSNIPLKSTILKINSFHINPEITEDLLESSLLMNSQIASPSKLNDFSPNIKCINMIEKRSDQLKKYIKHSTIKEPCENDKDSFSNYHSSTWNEKDPDSELNFLNDIRIKETSIEESFSCEHYFLSLKYFEFHTMILSLISIGSGIFYHHFKTYSSNYTKDNEILNTAKIVSLVILSTSNLFFIIVTIFRYLTIIRLKKSRKEILSDQNIFRTGKWKAMTLEILITIFNPVFFLQEVSFSTNEFWYSRIITYEINDFLCLILLIRTYTIIRFFISCSVYYDNRANRVVRLFGNNISRLFAVRCMVISDPYIFLFLVSAVIILTFSYMLRIIEGPVSIIDKDDIDLTVFQNCVWLIVVTMTTVGYGDYYPKTNFGRLLCILSALSGTVLVSFIVVAFTNSLKFTENEIRAFDQRERHDMKQIIEKRVGNLFLSIQRYHTFKRKYINAVKFGVSNENHIRKLRKDVEDALYLQIKFKRKFKNILQTIYDPLTEFDCIKQKIETLDQMSLGAIEHIPDNNKNIQEINKFIERIEKLKKEENSFLNDTDLSINEVQNTSAIESLVKNNLQMKRKYRRHKYNRKLQRVLAFARKGTLNHCVSLSD